MFCLTSSNWTTTSSTPTAMPWTSPLGDTTSPLAIRSPQSLRLTGRDGRGVTCQESRNLVLPFEPAVAVTTAPSAVLAVAATTAPLAVLAVAATTAPAAVLAVAYSCGTGKCTREST